MISSPRTSKLISEKYSYLPGVVAKLGPSEVGQIFKSSKSPYSFFPSLGLFSIEFSLGYCHNMHFTKRNGTNETEVSSYSLARKSIKKKWTLPPHAKVL